MSFPPLTPHCLSDIIIKKEKVDQPVVQIIECKLAHSNHLKVALNDGTHYYSAILTSQVKQSHPNILKLSIVRLNKYLLNQSQKQAIIILELDVLPEMPNSIIGSPQSLKTDEGSQESSLAHSNQMQATPQQSYQPPPIPPPQMQPPQPQAYKPPPPPVPQQGFGQNAPIPPPSYQPPPPPPPMTISYPNHAPQIHAQVTYPQQVVQQVQPQEQIKTIESLTNYTTNWTIITRVVFISDMKTYKGKDNRPGKLMSVTLKDKNGSMIRGTFFGNTADKFAELLRLDKVYKVSGGRIKQANPNFNNTGCDYEITFDDSTTFTELPDDGSIGTMSFHFVPLNVVADKKDGTIIDVIGWVTKVEDIIEFTSKSGNQNKRRRLDICDMTNTSVELTIFGECVTKIPNEPNFVIAVKEAKVGTFNGKSLSCFSGIVEVNPELPEKAQLSQWWNSTGQNTKLQTLSSSEGMGGTAPLIYLQMIDTNHLGQSEKGDFFMCHVTVMELLSSKHFVYPACPNQDCKGKGLEEQENGEFHCSKCNNITQTPDWRWNFTVKIGDFSGSAMAQVISSKQVGDLIFKNKTSQMVHDELEGKNEGDVRIYIQQFLFQNITIRARAKLDTYQNESRIKINIYGAAPTNYKEAACFYATEIEKQV